MCRNVPECAGMCRNVAVSTVTMLRTGQLGVRFQTWTTDLSFSKLFRQALQRTQPLTARVPGGLTLRGKAAEA